MPATYGVAIEVPLSGPYCSPGNAETMSTPGASTSGLFSNVGEAGPRELKVAIWSWLSEAPTVRALRAAPGESMPKDLPLLPAATTHTTPAAVALSMARAPGSSGWPGAPRLRFITSTASSVAGLPSGSRARSMAAMTPEVGPLPPASRTR